MSFRQGSPLFQIPVYAFTEASHYADLKHKRQPHVDFAMQEGVDERDAELRASSIYPQRVWDYNEVIGWVELWANPPNVVKGYLYWSSLSRVHHRRRVAWDYDDRDKYVECYVDTRCSGIEIAQTLKSDITESCSRPGNSGVKRHPDFRFLDVVAPLLDWPKLMRAP